MSAQATAIAPPLTDRMVGMETFGDGYIHGLNQGLALVEDYCVGLNCHWHLSAADYSQGYHLAYSQGYHHGYNQGYLHASRYRQSRKKCSHHYAEEPEPEPMSKARRRKNRRKELQLALRLQENLNISPRKVEVTTLTVSE